MDHGMGKGKLNKIFSYIVIYFVVCGGLEQIMLEASSCYHGAPSGPPNDTVFNYGANIVRPFFYWTGQVSCNVTSSRSKITFKFKGKSQLPSGIIISKSSPCSLTLQFRPFLPCHPGILQCTASNAYGSYTASIKVVGYSLFSDNGIKLDNKMQNVMIIGSNTTLTCNAFPITMDGQLYLGYRTKSGYVELKEEDNGKIYWQPTTYEERGRRRKFEIRNVNLTDARKYVCRILYANKCFLDKEIDIKVRPCHIGHYCERSSGLEKPCEKGTFNNRTGMFSKDDCRPCPSGHYCGENCSSPVKCPSNTTYNLVGYNVNLPMEPAVSEVECSRCPLESSSSCSKDYSCKFLCAENPKLLTYDTRKMMQLSCLVSDLTLMRDLRWKNDTNQIVKNDTDHLYLFEGRLFTLLLSEAEKGAKYTCEGTETNLWRMTSESIYIPFNFKSKGETSSGGKTSIIIIPISILGAFIFLALGFFITRHAYEKMAQRNTRKFKNPLR